MCDVQKTLDNYENGLITASETVCQLAYGAATTDIYEMMRIVPVELHSQLREYVERYKPGKMISFGGAPEVPAEALEKLRNWFAENQ